VRSEKFVKAGLQFIFVIASNIFSRRLISFWLILLTSNVSRLFAKESAGTSGAASLLIPLGVRSMGMGDAGVALISGSNGAHYNPASLAHTKNSEFSFSYHAALVDSSLAYIGYAKPLHFRGLNELGGAAILGDLLYVDKGKIEINQLNSDGSLKNSESKSAGYDLVVGFGYAEHFLKGNFGIDWLEEGTHSLGIIVKGIESNIVGTYDAQAVGFDVGYLGQFRNFAVGLAVNNFGSSLKFIDASDPLPVTFRGGFSYLWDYGNAKILLASDLLNQEQLWKARAGVEIKLLKMLALRAGWRFEPSGFQAGPTFGFGFDQGPLLLDYAFSWYGDLKDTHRVSLGYRFGSFGTH